LSHVNQRQATDRLVEVGILAGEGRFDYLLVESTGVSEPLPVAEPRLGRRAVLTLPLRPPSAEELIAVIGLEP
jgi:hypothetical protein